ncbi:DNA polymerase III subunit delta [Marinobacter sp. CHS3-4]|uniref:DNA polymerase III subunit delta n=1 Tax=Marinobacter sp. CHS3-4 TaxID=3045174 RepID=UPI0024B62ED3|nr:DNA polymerase III subunit delta [Marinobacter sp. CHS3-4]MDI9244897.1 DNA polymerase III subunit delta [Marinobacter sp. CHS3-4]
MKIQAGQLEQQLEKKLSPVYLVSGDEALLVQESCDQIRKAARKAGFEDRLAFHADAQFDWSRLAEEFNAMSLFAEKRRIEVHLPTGKLGDGRDIVERFLEEPPEDVILILISARLDAAETRRKWYKALQQTGVHLPIWPIDSDKFPGWLQQRARQHGISLTRGALALLAERLEGNLLAVSQELDRLALFASDSTVDEDSIEQAVQDSSRFNGFELVSETLAGRATHARKIAGALQHEGENPLGFLTLLNRDLNLAMEIRIASARQTSNESTSGFLKKRGIFQPQRARAIEQASRRLSRAQLNAAVELCSAADRAAKGFDPLPPWHHIQDLITLLANPA